MHPNDILARERINLPRWIRKKSSFTDKIKGDFLQSRVVFYPGARNDGHPIKLFGSSGSAFCFVYADQAGYDYGHDPAGYRVIFQEIVTWPPPQCKRPFQFNGTTPRRAQWTVFQRQEEFGPDHGHEFIALLYVHGEAFTVYWDLWAGNVRAPYAVLLIDHGFGGNSTGHRFGGGESPMYRWAQDTNAWPNWLLISDNTAPWPGYQRVSGGDPGGMHHDSRFLYSKSRR